MTSANTGTATTEECLKDFFGRYQWESVQPFLAEFSGVEKSTVRRWYNGQMPKGLELLRVRVVLEQTGHYNVRELQALAPAARQFARAIALNVITAEGARDLAGYRNVQDVYKLVLKAQAPLQYRWHRIERFVENSSAEIEEQLVKLQQRLSDLPLEDGYEPARREVPPDPAPEPDQPVRRVLPLPALPERREMYDDVALASLEDLAARDVREMISGLRKAADVLAHALDENGPSAKMIRRELRQAISNGELAKIGQVFEKVLLVRLPEGLTE